MAEPDVQVPAHEIVVAQTEKEIQDCFDVVCVIDAPTARPD